MYLKTIVCSLFVLCNCNNAIAQKSMEQQEIRTEISQYYYGITLLEYASRDVNKPNTAEQKKLYSNTNFRINWGTPTTITWDTHENSATSGLNWEFSHTTILEIDFNDIEFVKEAPLTINDIENSRNHTTKPSSNVLFIAYKDKQIKHITISNGKESIEMVSEVRLPIQEKSKSEFKIIQAFELLCTSSK
jgi:hypothetical protein